MAIDLSSSAGFVFKPILATNPIIPDNKFKPNKIMHEFLFSLAGTGDASAGAVTCNVNFGTFDHNHYIVITYLNFYVDVNDTFTFLTHTDRWDNLYFPNHSDETIMLWQADHAYWPSQDDFLQKPLYLGRPRKQDANPGLCQLSCSTNTDTKLYNFLIQGYTLERPLPFSSILQP